MKRFAVIIIAFAILFTFAGCDYYNDEDVHIALTEPDSIGLIEYKAGISTEANAARLIELKYSFQRIDDNRLTVKLPESIQTESGKKYKIDSFGGSTGVNASLERFGIIFNIEEGTVDESLELTIGVGSLPLDTGCWNDIQICSMADNKTITISVKKVTFLSDEPLVYFLAMRERDPDGEISDATFSDKWYKVPNMNQIGGERVVVKVKRPEGNLKRTLHLNNTPLEPVKVCEKYIQFEFVMPYHNTRIIIVDTKPSKETAYI